MPVSAGAEPVIGAWEAKAKTNTFACAKMHYTRNRISVNKIRAIRWRLEIRSSSSEPLTPMGI
jgi:hypothetical protein